MANSKHTYMKKKTKDAEEKRGKDFLDDDEAGGYKQYKKSLVTQYDVYLTNEVSGGVDDYQELLRDLDRATEDDVFNVRLSSYGGDCAMGFRLCYALKGTAAHVTMVVEGNCYSMGAILALCGSSLVMYPNTYLMFHNYSTYRGGKGAEMTGGLIAFNRHMYENFKDICVPFLTIKEIKTISNDADVYIHQSDKDFHDRVSRHFK